MKKYIIQNSLESAYHTAYEFLKDDGSLEFDTLEGAEIGADRLAANIAGCLFSRDGDNAIIPHHSDCGSDMLDLDSDFFRELSDDSGAKESAAGAIAGRLPWNEVVSKIRDVALYIYIEESADQPLKKFNLPMDPGPRRTPTPEEEKRFIETWTEYNRKVREDYNASLAKQADDKQNL